MSNNEPDDQSAADSQQGLEPQPAGDQPTAQADEQVTDQTTQSTEQSQEQPADQAGEQTVDTDQAAEQPEEQPTAETDQPADQSDQVAEAEGQQADKGDSITTAASDDTVASAGDAASPTAGGTGVQARPGPRPKRSPTPTLVKRRFVFRFATERSSVDNTPPALVDMVNNALAGGLLAFRIEEVVSGKTVLVGREIGAAIPKPTFPASSDVTKDDPGDLVYHFNTVGTDLSVSLVVTPPAIGNDFSNQLEKVITRTDWNDSTEAGLPEPTFFVKGSVMAGYSLVPVSDGETLDSALKARNISRNTIFYLSQPRARNDALHTMDYDVILWEFLSIWGERLTPR